MVDFQKVIEKELVEIDHRRSARKQPQNHSPVGETWQEKCHDKRLFGICISGGGIRSATFALGVLQGLAKKGLLQSADYVSTVSGGGYIGSWLQRILKDPINPSSGNAGEGNSSSPDQLYEPLIRDVPGRASEDPITFLRKYSNYLAPRRGFSLDTLLIPVIWSRNTILNQLIIVAAFLAALLVAFWPGRIFLSVIRQGQSPWFLVALAFVAGCVAVLFMATHLKRIAMSIPGVAKEKEPSGTAREAGFAEYRAGKGTGYVGWFLVFPIFLGVLATMFVVYGSGAGPETAAKAALSGPARKEVVSATIAFGGNTVANVNSPPQSNKAGGSYTVTASASEQRGTGTSTTTTVTVSSTNKRPNAALKVECEKGSPAPSGECEKGPAPLTVLASTAGSSDANATITDSEIDFGDDNPPVRSTEARYVYTTPGTYTITGTVTNNLGVSASVSKTVKVESDQAASTFLSRFPRLWNAIEFVLFFLLFLVLQERGGFRTRFVMEKRRERWSERQRTLAAWAHTIWMSATCAGLTLLLARLITDLVWHWRPRGAFGSQLAMAYAPPLYVLALTAGVGLQIGLMGRDFPDACREWLARAGTLFWMASALWAGYFTLAVLVPYWIAHAYTAQYGGRSLGSVVVAWLGATVASVFAGKSPKTSGAQSPGSEPGKAANQKPSALLDFIARYGALVAIGGFLVLLAFAAQWLLHLASATGCECNLAGLGINQLAQQYWYPFKAGADTCWYWPLGLTGGAAVIFLVLSWRVNINEFSMHDFYKNRLVRCYLGARSGKSEKKRRRPDWFTGFDPADDFPLSALRWPEEGTKSQSNVPAYHPRAPYPILNATVNVTAGTDLATQERKGLSWIFTPWYSGFSPSRSLQDRVDRIHGAGVEKEAATTQAEEQGKTYAPTDQLGGGIKLGTAMAISGAAANPNWGYHSAPQTAFLLTLFNVRLGWWMGNPTDDKAFRRPGPGVALKWLFYELLGLVDESSAYLNLSDGGHFENLGFYELARRRCRYIIAIDGEADKDYRFEGLGGAVRKCRDDFGIDIVINPRPIRLKDDLNGVHCAVGRIYYPDAHAEPGWLLYIKSSVTGDEPADVEEYRRENPDFPQQSTLDQFFSESQFESYRMLGFHVLNTVLDRYDPKLDMDETFERLAARWEVPPQAPEGVFTKQAEAYSRLMDRVAKDDILAKLSSQMGQGFPAETPEEKRKQFYFWLDLIQLMEDIFVDLNLADKNMWDHPRYAGWKRLFTYWAGQKGLQEVWDDRGQTENTKAKGQRQNYGKAFRYFLDDLITEAKNPGNP